MQAEAFLQLVVELVVGKRDDAVGVAPLLGPHDGRALSRQRQNGERPRWQEMLFGTAFMIALETDRGDDGGLIVVPAVGDDAGGLADDGTGAVGADQKARAQCLAVGERHIN